MSTSYLWGVDIFGKVFLLPTNGQHWEELKGQQLEMKRVSAVERCAWGLGCDHQVYVYVHSTDVPIRVQVKTFENQRWNPVDGFTSRKLLFKDRWGWSNEEGTKSCPKSDFTLPTDNWSWESDWYTDENIGGKPTGKGGWQYAVNFQTHYHTEKKWNSCVRRRKWIRYKRYNALDTWAKIPSPFIDALHEPFIDIAVGGTDLRGQTEGHLTVWTVSVLGRVFVREGINANCPEGTQWQEVTIDPDKEVVQISVGPQGSVWGVLLDGMAVVRCGVSRDHPLGMYWMYVCPPEDRQLMSVSVGSKAVWAVTREGKVWFRKGINFFQAPTDNFAALGVSWIEMVGSMSLVSVGPQDQVWALGNDDNKTVYFRRGVTPSEPYGKTWKVIECKEKDLSEALPHSSATSLASLLHSISMSEINENQQAEFTQGLIESLSGNQLYAPSSSDDDSREMKLPSVSSTDNNDGDRSGDITEKTVKFFMSLEEVVDAKQRGGTDTLEGTRPRRRSSSQSEFKSYWDTRTSDFPDNESSNVFTAPSQDRHQSSRECDSKEQTAVQENSNFSNNDSHDKEVNSSEKDFKVTNTDKIRHNFSSQSSYSSEYSDTIIDFVNDYDIEEESKVKDKGEDKVRVHSGMATVSFKKGASSCSDTDTETITDSIEGTETNIYTSNPKNSDFSQENTASGQSETEESSVCMNSFHHSLSDLCQHYNRGEISWVSVSGGGCVVNPGMLPQWFAQPKSSSELNTVRGRSLSAIYRRKIAHGEWRQNIQRQLQRRQQQEVENFKNYEHAIETTSWVKRGRMLWWREHRPHKWYDCNIELEQGSKRKLDDSTFSVFYRHHGKQKHVQLSLSEITCVLQVTSPDTRQSKSTFALITAKRTARRVPLLIGANSYEEMEDWISAISMSCCDVRGLDGAPSSRAVWSTTCHGDVFFHVPQPDIETVQCNNLYWHQIGGHMLVTECCPAGVVWGIGYDHTVWVYTGGYGGGPFKGATGIQKQTDCQELTMYQTQRWNPIQGFTDRGFLGEMFFKNKVSALQDDSNQVKLPSPHWQWINDWTVDYTLEGGTDQEGWQYANDFPGWYHKDKKWKDYVRRRRWVRKCKLFTTGPWLELPPLSLTDVSLQVDANENDRGPIALWAIAANGDVVTREGVTRRNPQGRNWLHVPSDQPFQSISVGGNYRVWGIAKDGSAYLRNTVNPQNIAGDCWFHVPPPHVSLRQVSAGGSAVYAVDIHNGLWYRKDITLTFPEGTRWIHVCNNIQKVSVGPKDQVWVLAEKVGGSHGVVCQRKGITPQRPTGNSWDLGIGGGWSHICIRGLNFKEEDIDAVIQDDMAPSIQRRSPEITSNIDGLMVTPSDKALC
ncbi:tectonin beta-propeller repeat-containing protein 1-like [Glandiceps talaboti]